MKGKQISVLLDLKTTELLEELMVATGASISDVVNTAILAMAQAGPPMSLQPQGAYGKVLLALSHRKISITQWCTDTGVDPRLLRYVCKRIDDGRVIRGKAFNKLNGKKGATHTGYIARCLEKEFGITSSSEDSRTWNRSS